MPSVLADTKIADILATARAAQGEWAATPLRQRLHAVRAFRHCIAESAKDLLASFPPELMRTHIDSLTAEILPLADACCFLEREAQRILRSRKLSARSRPWTFRTVGVEVRREPFGTVLIIGPSNYPLFLPAVQSLQALVAGNCVLWKPGRGGGALATMVALLARASGIPSGALQVLDESVEAASEAIASGVDKIVMTGSVESGRAVLEAAASQITPAVIELSGFDAVIVHATADIERAARAIIFGLRLNSGNTCIAPRRIFAHHDIAPRLQNLLTALAPQLDLPPLLTFTNDTEALDMANRSAYGLGASVFADPQTSQYFAAHLHTGVVVINDVIVPTADPRLPFGGRCCSGFGVTRGAEGLLEMTAIKAVAVQKGKRLRHLEPLPADAEFLFLHYLSAQHSRTWRARGRSWRDLGKLIFNMRKNKV